MELINQSGKESRVTETNTKVIGVEGGLPLICVSSEKSGGWERDYRRFI